MRTPEEWAGVIAESGYDLSCEAGVVGMKEMALTAMRSVALTERARAARIARDSVAADLAKKFPDARRIAEQIAADIEGDQP